jgi:glycosyltransferase involved in cell wall biosynthesis
MRQALIVLSTTGIGGAEKRFSELWLHMQQKGMRNVKLVLPEITYKKLIEIEQLSTIANYREGIVLYSWSGGSYLKQREVLIELIKGYDRDTIFHFVLGYPIFINLFNRYNIVYTYTSTSFQQLNFKGKIGVFSGFFEADRVDILDPRIAKRLQSILFWKAKRISNTPGSFVDSDYYHSAPIEQKRNYLVFLGRFEPVKQVVELVKAIPTINQKLRDAGIKDQEFFILGTGGLEKIILEYIAVTPSYRDIKIHIYFETKPVEILKYSKIFFSLQKYSNYPSKSLLEAISCGNLPIVTDNGDTRLIAPEAFSYYVEEEFSAEALAEQCVKILAMDNQTLQERVNQAEDFIHTNFSVEKNIEYFSSLYFAEKR